MENMGKSGRDSRSGGFDDYWCGYDLSGHYRVDAELNAEQQRVVREGDGPCLVLAGAGSGKTRTLTYRVAHLLGSGVPADRVMVLTFTNKAAREMLGRVEAAVGRAHASGVWGGTFHATANRILRQYGERIGYQLNFTILDTDDARHMVKTAVADAGVATSARRFPSPGVMTDVISYARNARVSYEEALDIKSPRFADLAGDVEEVARRYAESKKRANAMDFDDLLANFLLLLQTDTPAREKLANQFKYLLVDEYQDTNPLQAELTDILASKHRNLLVVGDDAQSIYSFRAASIENILSFPKRFPDAKTFRLETNYRSSPEILALANDIIEKNENQFEKTLRPVRLAHAKPVLVPTATRAEEAAFIAEKILDLHHAGTPLREIAVLFRSTYLTESLEFELNRRDIPYDYRGGMKFFERSHIKDIIAFLRFIQNSKDEAALARVLTRFPGIGEGAATAIIARLREGATDFDGELSSKVAAGYRQFADIIARAQEKTTPAAMIRSILTTWYADYLAAEHTDARARVDDLEQFALFAERSRSLESFLTDVSLREDYGAERRGAGEKGEKDQMVLSTIHQAKGLEWDTVFIISLTATDFPNRRAQLEENGIEEERRLFYVAATRARKNLFLTYPIASGNDMLSVVGPSMFLEELDRRLITELRPSPQGYEPVIEIERVYNMPSLRGA